MVAILSRPQCVKEIDPIITLYSQLWTVTYEFEDMDHDLFVSEHSVCFYFMNVKC